MTIDEAIAHCLEEAGEQQKRADSAELIDILGGLDVEACKECAADHRQLAEWLTDYKELKNSVGAVKLKDMKEAVKLLSDLDKENTQLVHQLTEAKWLLKAAVEDFAVYGALKDLSSEQRVQNPDWRRFNRIFDVLDHQWRYADEALKLIGGETDEQI